MFQQSCELKLIMKERQAGGKERTSGRYKAHDSARLHFLNTVLEPGIKMGVMPNAFDYRMLFDMPPPREIVGPDAQLMDAWSKAVKPDVKSKAAKPSAALDDKSQTTLLRWATP